MLINETATTEAPAADDAASESAAETDAGTTDASAEDADNDADDAGNDAADSESEEEDAEATDAAVVGEYQGMPVGITEEGYPFRGDPNAPITMYEFSDYQCPYCLRHFSQTESALNETYVQTGQVKVVFVDFPLAQLHPNAPAASAAALCVAEQSPVAFWDMHAMLFETQDEWANASDPNSFFIELAAQTDIELRDFEVCLSSGSKDAAVEESFQRASSLGFSGTPSFQFVLEETGETADLVGAQPFDRFSTWIDSLLAGEVPAEAASQDDGGGDIPYWATAEGLAPDPERPGYTMAGDQYRGDTDAEVVVIEYSDFQCPYCGRHVSTTQPVLDETFVDTGQVRWVFKHFPLNIHPQAPAAGVAAECAAEQDSFWDMHHLLFETTSRWSVNDPNPVFVDLAEELELDVETFEACLESEEMMARVESDFADGRPFVQGTPTFIIMTGEQGRIIPGALPAESFVEALEGLLPAAN